MLKTSSYLFLN